MRDLPRTSSTWPSCQDCRDEVGLDRALVRQLRTALAARIGDATPSPRAWEGVLARMRQPEPSVTRPWTSRLAAFLRAGSAMAGASLALVVALNLEMAPIGAAPSPDVGAVTASAPAGHGSGLRHWEGRAPAAERPRQRGAGLGRLGANRERAAAAGSDGAPGRAARRG